MESSPARRFAGGAPHFGGTNRPPTGRKAGLSVVFPTTAPSLGFAMADEPDPPRRTFALKPKEFERVNDLPGTPSDSPAHDVFAMQRQLREREQAAGMDHIEIAPKRRSRRKRDYWVSLAAGWGGLILIGGMTSGPAGIAAGAVLGLFYAGGLTWIMFGILSDY